MQLTNIALFQISNCNEHNATDRLKLTGVVIIVVVVNFWKNDTCGGVELSSAACDEDEFDCGEGGRCLSWNFVCDYFDDCVNSEISDEKNCTYPPGELFT